jgi:hypothetical protein
MNGQGGVTRNENVLYFVYRDLEHIRLRVAKFKDTGKALTCGDAA